MTDFQHLTNQAFKWKPKLKHAPNNISKHKASHSTLYFLFFIL